MNKALSPDPRTSTFRNFVSHDVIPVPIMRRIVVVLRTVRRRRDNARIQLVRLTCPPAAASRTSAVCSASPAHTHTAAAAAFQVAQFLSALLRFAIGKRVTSLDRCASFAIVIRVTGWDEDG